MAASPAPGKKRSADDGLVAESSTSSKKQKKVKAAAATAAASSSSSAPDALQRMGQVFAEEEEMLDYEVRLPTPTYPLHLIN